MFDVHKREEETLKYWKDSGFYHKLKERNKTGKKFYYLDGPPNAYGLAAHHLWVYTIKDLPLKYLRYRGRNVHDRPGFDVHGLPIENRVERSMNLASKDEIEKKVGVANFVKACREYVDSEVGPSIELLRRFGVHMDFDTTYLPYRSEYINKGWGIFKEMHKKGLLYKEPRPLAYCAHCGTVLSAQGPEVEYSDVTDTSIFVRYKIRKSAKVELPDNTYLVIWTTTPWTLPAHMAIAVNPDAEYVVADVNGSNYIVAKNRLAAFSEAIGKSAAVKKAFMGSDLAGTMYSSPLEAKVPMQKTFNKYHRVLLSKDMVSVSEGTGLLHVAPGHGPEDYLLAKANKIPAFSPIDLHARYTHEAGAYQGQQVPGDGNKAVLNDLRESGDLLYSGQITHTYPHCWRCHSKLVYRATPQWFIKISKIKKKMLKENTKIKWRPDYAQKWFADAIESSPDWCISRQRFWGSPLPIWLCDKCDEMEVIGSVDELVARAGLSHKPTDMELHKPHIDAVAFKCKKCDGQMKRVTDIFDVWYESGIAHTASLSDDEFARLYPADWITESLDQIRGWFTTLLRTGVAAHGKTPYKSVTIGGMMKDEFGEETHRSKGNAVSPEDILNMGPVDGWRLFCASKPRWQDLKLKKNDVIEANNHVIMLYNIAELVKEFAAVAGFDTKTAKKPSLSRLEREDLWILSRLNSLITGVTQCMDDFRIDEAATAMRYFLVEDFSRFYLKFAKQRMAEAKKGELKRLANLNAYVLQNLMVMLSVATPFVSEYINRELFSSDGQSVFLSKWPKASGRLVNKDLEQDMEMAKEAITALLNSREKAGIPLRWPIANATLEVKDDSVYNALERMARLVENYVNAKRLELKKVAGMKEEVRPVFAKIGPAFKENANAVAEALKNADAEQVKNAINHGGTYRLHTSNGAFDITPEYFTMVQGVEQGDAVLFTHGRAYVDKQISDELKAEAIVREFERRVQLARKELGLKKTDRVDVRYVVPVTFEKAISSWKAMIKKDIGAASLEQGIPEGVPAKEYDIEEDKIRLAVKKVS